MTTPTSAVPPQTRVPLRIRLSPTPAHGPVDGGWWPQSRDLSVELADLVDHFPPEVGRIVRAIFSPPDWDNPPRQLDVDHGRVKVGSFPRDDTHVIRLKMSDRRVVYLQVIPSAASADEAEDGLLAAAR
jgi:Family of unknown function (DUF5994)